MTQQRSQDDRFAELARLGSVRDRIDREFARPLDVEELARTVHMSAGHLSRRFREAFGEPPYRYLMTRRVERAMLLLRRGGMSVTDVCFAVGPVGPPRPTRRERFSPRGVSGSARAASSAPGARLDVGQGAMRWITVRPKGDDAVSIVLAPPVVDPAASDEERAAVDSLMAKGVFAMVLLATDDVDAEFVRIESAGADVIQEPTDQDWGPRDCALRDPAGHIVRLQQVG